MFLFKPRRITWSPESQVKHIIEYPLYRGSNTLETFFIRPTYSVKESNLLSCLFSFFDKFGLT